MARPKKTRSICRLPKHCHFTSEDNPKSGINLSVEEYEVVRLMDYLGMTQAECAEHMEISRGTVQALYMEARKKVARFLVEGTYMEIGGGDYQLCEKDCGEKCMGKCNHKSTSLLNNDLTGNSIVMRIAVTYENGQVFQHFGHTEKFKVYEIEEGNLVSSEVIDTNGKGHGALAGFLVEHHVDVLICGGIGGGARNALLEAGIDLYPGAVGDTDMQVESFLNGTLRYNPNTVCEHHHEEGHTCGEHGCGNHVALNE